MPPGHPIDRIVGENLRARRLELGLSRKTLAARIGVSAQQIAKYEQGQTRVSASTLYCLSRLLDTDIDDLFTRKNDPASAPIAPDSDRDAIEQDLRDFLEVYVRIRNSQVRHGLLEIIRSLDGLED